MAGTIGPLQLGILAILIIMTLAGLYYTGSEEEISTPAWIGFGAGLLVVVAGVFQSFGLLSSTKEEDPEKEADNLFEKRKEKRDQKRTKKEAAKAQEVALEEQEKAAKRAAKLLAQKAAKLEAKQEDAKKREEEKKKVEEEDKKTKKAKKVKKVKKDKEVKEPTSEAEKEEVKASEPEDWVVQPVREIKKSKDERPIEIEMLVSSKHYPALIGERARIEEICFVKLTFPRKNSDNEHIKLEGVPSAIEKAKEIIYEIAEKRYSPTLDVGAVDEKLEISAYCVGILLKSKAECKRILSSKTGVRIDIPEQKKEPKTLMPKKKEADGKEEENLPKPKVEITMVGDQAGIVRAKRALAQIEAEGYSDLTHEGYTKTIVAFPVGLMRILMAEKGEKLQAIKKKTNARIQLPPVEAKESKPSILEITIAGLPAEVAAASRELAAISSDFLTHEVDIPQSLVFLLAADKGTARKALQQKTGAQITIVGHLWDPSLRTLSISGSDRAIQAAVQDIAVLVSRNKILTMEFPADRIPALMGAKGENLQKLQSETGAHISRASHEWDNTVDIVTVVGSDEAISKATSALNLVINPPPREPREPREQKPREAKEPPREGKEPKAKEPREKPAKAAKDPKKVPQPAVPVEAA